ncbi:hypothetical protein B0I32_124134 [Nonomuraea fuscirosea]|uniref:Peptidase inhibitor family I36 n=1 Tax=Nonomuraea fuscirosea TaxID=1291556 RepID=A0A2T0MKL5_9ACTN|nr:hypothetical protein [Nonomuraea fuscirosea]PRX58146.1 hypothetical protein B0I32_124134 [Nonomuraea fuscirosea]
MLAKITTALAVAASLALTPVAAHATATTATAKPNLRACYDGKCKLTLTKSVSFRVSSRFGITRLAIAFNSSTVKVRGTGAYVSSQAVLGRGSTGSVNGIGVRILSLSGSKAVLRLSPVR